jgi:hypothetical protein
VSPSRKPHEAPAGVATYAGSGGVEVIAIAARFPALDERPMRRR